MASTEAAAVGGRDAWSVGLTARYGVFVWSGNASGEGRSAVSGLHTAAPILFDVFNILPHSDYFEKPQAHYVEMSICPASGMRAGPDCPLVIQKELPPACSKAPRCPYHKRIFLDENGHRAFKDCYTNSLKDTVWFNLPPGMAWYYGKWHSNYKNLPPLSSGCATGSGENTFRIIYPLNKGRIRLSPQSGSGGAAFVAEASAIPNTMLYWHLDRNFLGITLEDHRLSIEAKRGWHVLTVVNARGERKVLKFELLSSE
jgi:penicillin-binding protein 1C